MRLSLDKKEFFQHLAARGFTHLFHANTVETSISFFSVNSLASREFIEKSSLPQSAQFTDETDKKFGIWNDLFLNFHDHHRRFNRPNAFGPIAFRFRISDLEEAVLKSSATISVCKKNAEAWAEGDMLEERWTANINELNALFKEPVQEGQRRGFFKDGTFPDIVIGGLGVMSLKAVDKVIVEQNSSLPGHLEKFQTLVSEVWPAIYRRPEIIVRRAFCPAHCTCGNKGVFDGKLQRGFSFGQWEARLPHHFTEPKRKVP